MFIYVVLFNIVSLGIGIVFWVKKKLRPFFRISTLLICAAIFLASSFLGVVMMDGYRINRSAEVFIRNLIENSQKSEMLTYATALTADERRKLQTIIKGMPDCPYKIEYDDMFYESWEYIISFENGKKYFIAVDIPGSFFSLFNKAECRLLRIEDRTENVKPSQAGEAPEGR